jgi:hypothetical protein
MLFLAFELAHRETQGSKAADKSVERTLLSAAVDVVPGF